MTPICNLENFQDVRSPSQGTLRSPVKGPPFFWGCLCRGLPSTRLGSRDRRLRAALMVLAGVDIAAGGRLFDSCRLQIIFG